MTHDGILLYLASTNVRLYMTQARTLLLSEPCINLLNQVQEFDPILQSIDQVTYWKNRFFLKKKENLNGICQKTKVYE